MSDVTAAIVFHREGPLAEPSITSFTGCCDEAASRGIDVTRMALLDRPDDVTLEVVESAAEAYDHIEIVDHADLGKTRNAGVELTTTKYVTFFDGDDLWGAEWITRAHREAEKTADPDLVLHPQVLAYFSADDGAVATREAVPAASAKSYYLVLEDSRAAGFDPRALVLSNMWSANAFAHTSVYRRFPFRPVDRSRGFGVEDWTWNMETLVAGIDHAVVRDTVHCVRMRPSSLSAQNIAEGTTAPVQEYAARLETLKNSQAQRTNRWTPTVRTAREPK